VKIRTARYNRGRFSDAMPHALSNVVRPVLLVLAAVTVPVATSPPPRTFDADAVGRPPAGFTFHVVRYSSAPRWLVQREGANGYLAHGGDPSGHTGFDLAVLDGEKTRNVSVSARLRLAAGQRSGGLVWRVQDAENYYLARLDLDRQDVALYRVSAGNRTRIEGEDDLELDATAWHTLRVAHEDEEIRVYLGGIRVLRARDRTFPQPGGAGLWCAGDAVAHFDDFKLGPTGDGNGDRDNDADSRRRR
jgi:hypothetical protein